MNNQQTLVIIKPDAVKKSIVGEIIKLYENKGLKIKQMKMLTASEALLEDHYAPHVGKPFYKTLLTFMQSGPMIVLVLEGPDAVEVVRKINGATNYLEAEYGSIRGLFAHSVTENCVHGSDSEENAIREIEIWFQD
jgi:nucleoside-diphosphate kinase